MKGHSARVPGKNMREFAGRPLFHAVVNTLLSTRHVRRVVIDTDSDEIKKSARQIDRVEIIDRNPKLIGDEVSVNLLIKDYLLSHDDDQILQTHSTNPLLRPQAVDAAIERFLANEAATSLFSVTRLQERLYDKNLNAINHDPSELIPTQDLDPIFLENSNFYVFTRDGFLERETRITSRPIVFEMDPLEAIDIDEEHDFRLAEILYRQAQAGA